MTPTVSSNTSAGAPAASGTSTAAQSASDDKNMFLQLLVAQLQNQDPLNPTDGTQFLGELAQFQQLETSVNMGSDITAIRQDLDQLVGGTTSTGGKS